MAVVQPSNNQYLALPFPLFLKTYPFYTAKAVVLHRKTHAFAMQKCSHRLLRK